MATLFATTADGTVTYSNFNDNNANNAYEWTINFTTAGIPTVFKITNHDSVGATANFYIKALGTIASTTYGSATGVTLVAGENTINLTGGALVNTSTAYHIYMNVTSASATPPRIKYNTPGTPKNVVRRSSASNIDPDTAWFSADIIMTVEGIIPNFIVLRG